MGAAISLRLALDARVKRVSVFLSDLSSRRSSIGDVGMSRRRESRKSRQEKAIEMLKDVDSSQRSSFDGSGETAAAAAGASSTEIAAACQSRPKLRLLSQAVTRVTFGTPWAVVTSKFVWYQVLFNMVSSALCSLGMFYLLFVVAVVPPDQRDTLPEVPWTTPNLIGVVLGSVLFVSPTLVMILAPAGLPEAVEQQWVCVVRSADCDGWLLTAMPFLGDHKIWRIGCARHLAIGVFLSVLIVPPTLLLAANAVASIHTGMMGTWTLIIFDLVFETLLSIPCTILGLLAFCMQPNYQRVKDTMSTDKHAGKRIGKRILGCLRLLW